MSRIVRRPPEPPARRPRKKNVSPYAAPFVWWARHPWVVVWVAVFLSPFVVVVLRLVDDAGYAALVGPLQWVAIGVLAVTLVLAAAVTARRSTARTLSGLGLAVVGVLILVLPTTHVVLGRTACPARAGRDLGLGAALAVVEAWHKGQAAEEAWASRARAAAWSERMQTLALDDYRLVDSGCWERIAPVQSSPTWHELRVTVREDGRAPLSKVVVVHVADRGGAWKVTGIDGPLP